MTPRLLDSAVARHALRHEVVLRLRMEEQHGAHRLRRLEQRQVLRLVPVLAVHDRVELGALEAEDGHRALELVDRRLDVLHGQRREPREAAGPLAGHPRDLVVHLARERPPRRRVEVIAEERRVNRDHLDVDALRVHVGEALLRREAHLGRAELDAPAAADHGAETVAGLVAIAVPRNAGLGRPPQRLRHEMRVNVDRPHDLSPLAPVALQAARQAILTAAACSRPSSTTLSWRIRNFCTLPVTVIGKPSTNFT